MTGHTQDSQIKVGIGCIVWRDGKFMMQRRLGSHGTGTWSIPGGKLEFGESWEACAGREVLEETGMTITNIRFFAVTNDIFSEEGKHFATIWMESEWVEGEPTVLEPGKAIDPGWYTFKTMPSPLFEPCWQNLRQIKPELFM